ncbi:MAG: MBL fold metallo-hydrolase [Deltaproteobacteria bacterium]|nr:MBL fold metallo-hydrolase [Deltaproteobacteria bacterium]
MSFFVRFWGIRGSIPTPGHVTKKYGGNTSCVEIRSDDSLFICDGGTGLRELGADLMTRGKKSITGHFFYSHTHWDHIQGFPFFTPAYIPSNTFHVYGTAEGDRRTYELLSGQMRSDYFPVDFGELRSNIVASHLDGGHREIDGVAVSFFEQHHPGRSWAYSFVRDGFKIVYATDNEIDLTFPRPEAVLSEPDAPRPVPEEFRKFCHGADLLIADGQYFDDEYEKKVGWGHPRATTVIDLALQAECKQVAIFHHDPMHGDGDVDRKIALCKERAARVNPQLLVFGAREGLELRIG